MLDGAEDEDTAALEEFVKTLKQRPAYGTLAEGNSEDDGGQDETETSDRTTRDTVASRFRKRVRIHLHR